MVLKNPDFEKFLAMLIEATGQVEDTYFQVRTASENDSWGMYKERVYCYELYHQLRNLRSDSGPYVLMGEIDKHRHKFISGGVVPDFVFHVPGNMDNNLVVMEVKRIDNNEKEKIEVDCKKLRKFVEEYAYKGAIYLVFGDQDGQIDKFREIASQNLNGLKNGTFVLLWHKHAYERAGKELRL
jgi:predicted phosphodiesterase